MNLEEDDISEILNRTDENGWGPIHYTCARGPYIILKELLKHGCNVNAVTSDAWTALQLACSHRNVNCVNVLVAHPMLQINRVTHNIGTALHVACGNNDTEMISLLLSSSANPNIANSQGKLPVEMTENAGIVQMISKYMGDNFIAKYNPRTPVQLAASFCGQVYWSIPWQINDKFVYIILDVEQEKFLHYHSKQTYIDSQAPDIVLRIQDIQSIKEFTTFSPEPQYFFIVKFKDTILKYYNAYEDMTREWVSKMREAAKYQYRVLTNTVSSDAPEEEVKTIRTIGIHFEEDAIGPDNLTNVNYSSFDILEELGSGGFAKVYKVVEKATGDILAMKAFSKGFLKRQQRLKYAIAECKILKSIRHPHIIQLYHAFQTPKNLYMILEYCPLGDMERLIKAAGKLTESQAKVYLSEVITAIEYLHSLNVIYRDLKPPNILIDSNGHAKLSDFGLAKDNVTEMNPTFSFCGSPVYLPPEVFGKQGVWKPADIYMLGVNLYEMIVGKLPFCGKSLNALYKQINSAKVKVPSFVSKAAKSFIIMTMNRNSEYRPDIVGLKKHPFFNGIDWEEVAQGRTAPAIRREEIEGLLSDYASVLIMDDKDEGIRIV